MNKRLCCQCPGTGAQVSFIKGETGLDGSGSAIMNSVVMIVFRESRLDHDLAVTICIYLCHRFRKCSRDEIATYFGVDEDAVIERCNRFESILCRNQFLAEWVAGLLAEADV